MSILPQCAATLAALIRRIHISPARSNFSSVLNFCRSAIAPLVRSPWRAVETGPINCVSSDSSGVTLGTRSTAWLLGLDYILVEVLAAVVPFGAPEAHQKIGADPAQPKISKRSNCYETQKFGCSEHNRNQTRCGNSP